MTAKQVLGDLRAALLGTAVFALILCGAYPLTVWGIGQVFFAGKANGSIIVKAGKPVGSRLIGQGFTGPRYFHPRPSAAGSGYDATASGGSNLGPLSRKLQDGVKQRVGQYRAVNGLPPSVAAPADAVAASGSGLDPHISLQNALIQAPRVARERGVSESAVVELVQRHLEGRDLGILGEPRVNVLLLNLALLKVTGTMRTREFSRCQAP